MNHPVRQSSLICEVTHALLSLGASGLAVLLITLGFTLLLPPAFSQSGAGSIQGMVQDATNAVIPGATITVINRATGVAINTKSNSVGFYQVPGLFAATYVITVTAPNMKEYRTSIDLMVAQTAVVNPVLIPGSVTQEVVVAGNTMQLTTTDNGSLTSTLDNTRIDQLPENGRSLLTLAPITTPGMLDGGKRAYGVAMDGVDYVIDGASTMEVLNGGANDGFVQLIDPDSIQEVTMEMDGSGAKYATPVTGVVTTKGGTNQLHGTFFETARNNGLGIAKSRMDPPNLVAPELIRNEFGLSAGGPIVLPHIYHGKDRSFWFFAYERYSLAQNSAVSTTVPTDAMRQGIYTGLVNGAGTAQVIYDPATTANSAKCAANGAANAYCRTPFPNNVIPAGEESPTAKIAYELTPEPTSAANPLVANNYNATEPVLQIVPQMTVRLDHDFNENNRAYVRYTQVINGVDISGGPDNVAAPGIPVGAAQGYQNYPDYSYSGSLGYTHVFSPSFFSETVLSQQWYNHTHVYGTAPNVNYESMLGLPNNTGNVGFPALGDGILWSIGGSQYNTESTQIISIIDENLTKTIGRHQLEFGGRFRHLREMDLPAGLSDVVAQDNEPTGVYDVTTKANYGTLPNTGFADASFFLGSNYAYQVNLEPPHSHYHTMEFDPYIQDNYHVSKNLTFNIGLRYEAHPALWYKYGLSNSFDLKNDAVVLAVPPAQLIAEGYTTQSIISADENIGVKFETPQQAGMPSTLMRNYDLNFLPRVGIAYQPFSGRHGTVVRGAYGRYDYPLDYSGWLNQTIKNNPLTGTWTQDYTNASQAIDDLPNELIRYNDPAQFGVMGVNTTNVVNTSTANSIVPGIVLNGYSQNWAPTYVTETNFTIEQALKGNSALSASWVWTHSTNLQVTDSYNQHPTTYQWEMATGTVPPTGTYSATATGPYDKTTYGANLMYTTSGWGNYNGLIVNYQRLFHHGSAYQISYAYAKSLSAGGTVHPDADYPGVLGTVATMTSPYGTIGFAGTPPPPRPSNLPAWANWHDMEKYQNYSQDTAIPTTEIKFNGIVDVPVGRGKRLLGNANRFVNEFVGGFQLAGAGEVVSQAFSPGGDFGPTAPIQIYKHKMPITDCTSGVCYKEFMWFNGYIPPSEYVNCTTNCISGLPSDYQPEDGPIDRTPGTTYYGKDEVEITAPNLNGGKATNIVYDAGPQGSAQNAHTYLQGPIDYYADLSLFKVFPITERVNLRFNMDAFNAFNIQGYQNPAGTGIEKVQPGVGQVNSHWSPRQIQLTMRLTF